MVPSGNNDANKIDHHKFSHISTVLEDHFPGSFVAELQTISTVQTMTQKRPKRAMEDFESVIIDTDASYGGTCGMRQFCAYC